MTARTRSELATQITTLLLSNSPGNVSAADIRSVAQDIVDSLNAPNINIDSSAYTANLHNTIGTLVDLANALNDEDFPPLATARITTLEEDFESLQAGSGNAASWAESGNTATIPDAKLAANITRDSELTAHADDEDAHHTPGTVVSANPAGTDGSDLTRLAVAGTNYNLAGGDGVVANPAGTDGDDLTRVSIGGTNYIIAAGDSDFISPNSDGTLPDAVDNQGKFVISGNFLFESIDHGGVG